MHDHDGIAARDRPALEMRHRGGVAHHERIGRHAQARAVEERRRRRLCHPRVLGVGRPPSLHHRHECLGDELRAAYAIGSSELYLLGILNSRLFWFIIGKTSIPFGERAGEYRYRLIHQYMEKVPIVERDRLEADPTRAALPAAIEADSVEAKIADGILTLKLPKAESARPKKIQIKVK